MTTISVPLDNQLIKFIEAYIASGKAETKTQVVRQALRKLSEEEAFLRIQESLASAEKYGILRGDLKELARKYN